jgi:DNA-directed RNA polymerase specialized sigma24 family protein
MLGRGSRTDTSDECQAEDRAIAWWRGRVDPQADGGIGSRRVDPVRASWPVVERLIRQCLTPRQREIVELHFFRGFDQPAVALLLGISQQAVSEHLHGKRRGDQRVGGIIPKLRKLCEREGLAVEAQE